MLIGRNTIRSLIPSRRVQSAVVLFCFMVPNFCTVLPVAPEKDHSQRYPCEHHACGCRSAEACWRKCCCMTRDQKLAWAKANQVTPPAEFLLAEAKDSSQEKNTAPEKDTTKEKTSPRTCCAHKAASRSCCSSHATKSSPKPPTKRRSAEEPSGFVMVSQYLGCQGIAYAWMHLQVTLPQQVSTLFSVNPTPVGTLSLSDERLTHLAAPPDAPPPRLA